MGGKDKQIKKSNKGNKNVINTSSNQNADSLETITLQNSQDIVFDNAVGNESVDAKRGKKVKKSKKAKEKVEVVDESKLTRKQLREREIKKIKEYEADGERYQYYGIKFQTCYTDVNALDDRYMRQLKLALHDYLVLRDKLFDKNGDLEAEVGKKKANQQRVHELTAQQLRDLRIYNVTPGGPEKAKLHEKLKAQGLLAGGFSAGGGAGEVKLIANTTSTGDPRSYMFNELSAENQYQLGLLWEDAYDKAKQYVGGINGLALWGRGKARLKQVKEVKKRLEFDNRRFWLSNSRRALQKSLDMQYLSRNHSRPMPTWLNMVTSVDKIALSNQAYEDKRREQRENDDLPGLLTRHNEWWASHLSNQVTRFKILVNATGGLIDRTLGFGTMLAANTLNAGYKVVKAPFKLLSMLYNVARPSKWKRWKVSWNLKKGWSDVDKGRVLCRECLKGVAGIPTFLFESLFKGFPYLCRQIFGFGYKDPELAFDDKHRVYKYSRSLTGDIGQRLGKLVRGFGIYAGWDEKLAAAEMANVEEGLNDAGEADDNIVESMDESVISVEDAQELDSTAEQTAKQNNIHMPEENADEHEVQLENMNIKLPDNEEDFEEKKADKGAKISEAKKEEKKSSDGVAEEKVVEEKVLWTETATDTKKEEKKIEEKASETKEEKKEEKASKTREEKKEEKDSKESGTTKEEKDSAEKTENRIIEDTKSEYPDDDDKSVEEEVNENRIIVEEEAEIPDNVTGVPVLSNVRRTPNGKLLKDNEVMADTAKENAIAKARQKNEGTLQNGIRRLREIYNINEKKEHDEALKKAGIPELADKRAFNDYVERNLKHWAEMKQSGKYIVDEEGRRRTASVWNQGLSQELILHLEWLKKFYDYHDPTLDINRTTAIPEAPNVVYRVETDITGMDEAYERQGTNNCYACSGTAILNHFIARKKKEQKLTRRYNQFDLRAYKPGIRLYDPEAGLLALDKLGYDFNVKCINHYAGAGKKVTGNVFALGDFIMDKLSENGINDAMLNRVIISVPKSTSEKRDKTLLENQRRFFKQKIGEIIDGGGVASVRIGKTIGDASYDHYLTITGVNNEEFKVYDSSGYSKPTTWKISDFVAKGYTVDINWISDVKKPGELTAEYSNLKYDPKTGYDLKNITQQEYGESTSLTRGVVVVKDDTEIGEAYEGIAQMAYIPDAHKQIKSLPIDDYLRAPEAGQVLDINAEEVKTKETVSGTKEDSGIAEETKEVSEIREDKKDVSEINEEKKELTEEELKEKEEKARLEKIQSGIRKMFKDDATRVTADFADAKNDLFKMEKIYERQDKNNSYACSGTAILNHFIARKKGEKKVTRRYQQKDLRVYKPAIRLYDPAVFDKVTDKKAYDEKVKIINKYAGKGKEENGNLFAVGDFIFDRLKENGINDVMLNRIVMDVPEKIRGARDIHKRLNMRNVFKRKIGEIINDGGIASVCVTKGNQSDYLTITSIRDAKIEVYDSKRYSKPKMMNVEDIVDTGCTIEINWISDLKEPKELTAEFKNLKYDKNTGYELNNISLQEVNESVSHTKGVTVIKDSAELGAGYEDITRMAYIPDGHKAVKSLDLDEYVKASESGEEEKDYKALMEKKVEGPFLPLRDKDIPTPAAAKKLPNGGTVEAQNKLRTEWKNHKALYLPGTEKLDEKLYAKIPENLASDSAQNASGTVKIKGLDVSRLFETMRQGVAEGMSGDELIELLYHLVPKARIQAEKISVEQADADFDIAMVRVKKLFYRHLKRLEATYGRVLSQMHPEDVIRIVGASRLRSDFAFVQDLTQLIKDGKRYFDPASEQDKEFVRLSNYYNSIISGGFCAAYAATGIEGYVPGQPMFGKNFCTEYLQKGTKAFDFATAKDVGGPSLTEKEQKAYIEDLHKRSRAEGWSEKLFGMFNLPGQTDEEQPVVRNHKATSSKTGKKGATGTKAGTRKGAAGSKTATNRKDGKAGETSDKKKKK